MASYRITIEFSDENAEFDDVHEGEVTQFVLGKVSDRAFTLVAQEYVQIRDTNGNLVGEALMEEV